MAKFDVACLVATSLCFMSFARIVCCEATVFRVEGEVYCDTCRTRFVTKVSEFMKDATVRLECRDRLDGRVTYELEGVTNSEGRYRLEVEGEHEDEICAVELLKSSRHDCNELPKVGFGKYNARIGLTKNNGITSLVRFANPLGFYKEQPLPECPALLRELDIEYDGGVGL